MSVRRVVRCLPIVLALAALLAEPAGLFAQENTRADARPGARAERRRREGIVLAQFSCDASRERIDAALAALGGCRERRLEALDVDLLRIPKGMREEVFAAKLRETGVVAWAHPDYVARPCVTPNDPYYSYQWHHGKISAPAAWDKTTGSLSLIVAVVDTGVYAAHPDLSGRVLAGWNTAKNSTDTTDLDGHGTACAGIIAAAGNNSVGVAGVCWQAKILPVRVTSDGSGDAYDSDISEGWRWAADHGAKVINCSFGPLMEYVYDSAAKYCESKGAVVLASSSNEGAEYAEWPDYASIVFVGATGSGDTRASYSSWGNYVDCAAPGVSIVTTSSDGGYEYFGGTSAASPVAAGVAALIRARNPSLTPAQVKTALLDNCDDKGTAGEDKYYGRGRVNALKAVTAAGGAATNLSPTVSLSATPTSGTAPVTVSFTATASDPDGSVVSTAWSFGDGTSGSGSTISHTYSAAGSYTATVTVTDDKGAKASKSVTITASEPADTTPPPKPTVTSVVNLGTGGALKVTWGASTAPDLDVYYVVRYDSVNGYVGVGTYGPGTTSLTDSGLVNGRTYYYWVRAYDLAGNASEWSSYKYATPTGP